MELTARRGICGGGNIPLENYPVHLHVRVRHRHRRKQCTGIRVEGISEYRGGVALLHHVAEVHDKYSVCYVLDDREVVGYEYIGQLHGFLELLQKIYYLRLNRDVKGGYRLVAYYELGLHGQRAGYTYSLPLPSGELMRVSVVELGAEPAFLHYVKNVGVYLLRRDGVVHAHSLGYNVSDGHTRREARIRVLKYKLYVGSVFQHLPAAEVRYVVSLKINFSAVRVVETEDSAPEGRLSAAGLADDAYRRTLVKREGYIVHRAEPPRRSAEEVGLYRKVFFQVLDPEYFVSVPCAVAGRAAFNLFGSVGSLIFRHSRVSPFRLYRGSMTPSECLSPVPRRGTYRSTPRRTVRTLSGSSRYPAGL